MKKGMILIVFAVFFLTINGQSMSSVERNIGNFTGISVSNGVDVILTAQPTSLGKIKVEANNQDVLSKIITTVDNNTLNIKFEKTSGKNYKNLTLKVYVPSDGLNRIKATSGSDIYGQEHLTFKDLEISISGGSDIDLNLDADGIAITMTSGSDARLKGTAGTLKAKGSGGSDLYASGFHTENAEISLNGGSDADIYASESLIARLRGGSDLKYRGNPTEKNISADKSSDVRAK